MAQFEGKWRQPLLRDGNPVPVASYANRNEGIIDFSISCRDLLDNSVEDVKCFCVAYYAEGSASGLSNTGADQCGAGTGSNSVAAGCIEIGRTEVVYNSVNPDFSTVFSAKMSTYFDKLHDIIVAVYSEEDLMSDDLEKQRYLGCARFRLESVLRKVGCHESLSLETGGYVTINAKPSDVDSEFLVFCYSGKGFKKTSKNPIKAKKKVPKNPYIVLSYMSQKHSKWRVLWKSEVSRRSETDNFGIGQFQILRVNGADEETLIQALGMDWDEKNHKYKVIGQAEITLREMFAAAGELDLVKKGKCTGHLVPELVERVNVPTMANYLVHGGCSLNITFAVDFTSNNGGPGIPNSVESLHHLQDWEQLNSYEIILKHVGSIFQEYMNAPKFQLWGYGSILKGTVDHHFVMGGEAGICDGVEGVMSAYSETVRRDITMSGPKVLRPTIDAAIEHAMRLSQSRGAYSILMVLCCDGAISDITEVMEKLSQASFVPLSVIFVGVGSGEFRSLAEMNVESASLMSPSGNEFMRDVSSVVKFSNRNEDVEKSIHDLLEKVPSQIVQYNLFNKMFPLEACREDANEEEEAGKESGRAHPKSSMETVATKNKSMNEYGKFLRDSMVDLDVDEDNHASEANALESNKESRTANAESSMENVLRKDKTDDYGKFLRDSMADLDFEDPHTSEANRLESSSSGEDPDIENF